MSSSGPEPRCWVVKVGGSLIPDCLAGVIEVLRKASESVSIVVIPGGGRIVDALRDYRRAKLVSEEALYECALLAMLQHAILIKYTTLWPIIREYSEIGDALARGVPAIFAPRMEFMRRSRIDGSHMDRMTSDTIAALCARYSRSSFVKMTTVDGIFDKDPRRHWNPPAKLLTVVGTASLLDRTTCIDPTAPSVLDECAVDAWIINGQHPTRLLDIINGRFPIGTRLVR